VARWGHSTHIFAWELFNEADITQYPTFDAVVDWHKEMSEYLKQVDPNRHLVTTSVSQKTTGARLWDIASIDFAQSHIYGPDMAARALDQYLKMRDLKKPFFIAEYGRGTSLAEADQDRLGRDLRDALWGTFMLPIAGSAMPWWWDAHIKPNNLTRTFLPLSRFAEGIDRRTQNYTPIETAILMADNSEVAARGLLSHNSCYLWLHRQKDENGAPKGNAVLIPAGHEIALSGMLGGKYAVTILDTATGGVLRSSAITSDRGRLVVPLVRSEDDIAVKIQYQGNASPHFFASPEMLRLEEERLPAQQVPPEK